MVDPATILAHPKNWRTHGPEQRSALIAELDRVGFVQSVVVNRTTGHLVDGHLRVEVAVERRVPTIPVVYVELTEEEEARVLVALDPLSSMAGADATILASLMEGLALENEALERHLVSFLAGPKAPTGDPEYVPPVQPETYVQPGELWLLGDHRLLCGDATKPEDVARLLGDARPSLMVAGGRGLRHAGRDHWQHEPCFYAVRKGATAGWVGPTFDSTVWEVNTLGGYLQAGEADQATEHSTQKPVEVMQRPMRYHEGDVYEPFLGSGTTLIAAEQVGRQCFAMELAPRYVQVAIERWQAFTGREAVRG